MSKLGIYLTASIIALTSICILGFFTGVTLAKNDFRAQKNFEIKRLKKANVALSTELVTFKKNNADQQAKGGLSTKGKLREGSIGNQKDKRIGALSDLHPKVEAGAAYDLYLFIENVDYYVDKLKREPNRLDNLLDAYWDLNNEDTKSHMKKLLTKISREHNNFIQKHLIDNIVSQPDDAKLTALYSELNPSSIRDEDIEALRSVMPVMSNPDAIENGIKLIASHQLEFGPWSDADIEQGIDIGISEYFDSPSENVRLAVIKASRSIPIKDKAVLLANALDDQSRDVRLAAIEAVSKNSMQKGTEVLDKISNLVSSNDSSYFEKLAAVSVVERLAETEDEKMYAKKLREKLSEAPNAING